MDKLNLKWLEKPEIFQVNRLKHHSDHKYYKDLKEELNDNTDMKLSLNGSWFFNYSKNLNSIVENFYNEDYDFRGWDSIEVPGHLQLQGYDSPQYVNIMYPWDGHEQISAPNIPKEFNPVGSYIREFEIPKDWDGNPIYISFQGVESAFYIWINGKLVGYSEDSFTPSEFDISYYVKKGINKIAVMVVKFSSASWLEDQDFWRFSGIFRDVYLYTVPKTHIRDLFIKTNLKNNYKDSDLDIEIDLQGNKNVRLSIELQDSDEKSILDKTYEALDLNNKLIISEEVKNINLWSAEDPNLYKLYIKVIDLETEELIEVVTQRVGFREFKLEDKIMKLNGKRIVFKGVNRHEFSMYHGRAVKKEEILEDIIRIKENNINAIRTSHYPNQSYFYELCDEYGIYVIDEANLETHGTWQFIGKLDGSKVIPDNKEEWTGAVLDRASAVLERDKNHPSILMWSCGNESYGGEIILKMSNIFRERDNTRLVHYEGLFNDRRFNDTSDVESRMYARVWDVEEYLNNNPKKPFILCEYTHAMGNSIGGMFKYTDLEDKYQMYQGGFIWDYIDQGILTKDRYGKEYIAYGGDFNDRPTDYNFCGNGIVYADRKPSPKMQEVKYNYQNFKILVDKERVIIENKNLFVGCENNYLELSILKDGELLEVTTLDLNINPQEKEEINIKSLFDDSENGEYAINASIKLKEDTIWAKVGHELAFGQFVYTVGEKDEEELKEKITVIDSDYNLGIKGKDFHIIFSKNQGGLVSYKYRGKEFISSIPKLNFWRALTDNDNGSQTGYKSALWKGASLYQKLENVEVSHDSYKATIIYDYTLPIEEKVTCKVTYETYGDGKIDVKVKYNGAKNLPNMLDFGMIFKIPAEYNKFKYYGYGPSENYVDRIRGARLGIFETTAEENFSKYFVPQECGNRSKVRWAKITDNKGTGLQIESDEINVSVLPYTISELESASHVYELPNVYYSVIKISHKHSGIGGDDSWGAMPHDEFLIDSSKDMEFEFSLKVK